jgi:transcriptional regulator with XRE-family HTH domain
MEHLKWNDLRKQCFTPEEIAASDLRVALIGELIEAREKRGLSQKKLEEISGVKQPVIARIEKGNVSPQVETLIKLLVPLGKTLYIGELNREVVGS